MTEKTHPCPQCAKELVWNSQNAYRPFCSERCRLIDLGEWVSGTRAIPGEPLMDDEDFDALAFESSPDT